MVLAQGLKIKYNASTKTLGISDDVYNLLETYRTDFTLSPIVIMRSAFECYGIDVNLEPINVIEEQQVLHIRMMRFAGKANVSLEDIARQLQARVNSCRMRRILFNFPKW